MIENTRGFIDGYCCFDDSANDQIWIGHEGNVRKKTFEYAREMGADWVLCIDPDERFEVNAGNVIKKIVKKRKYDKTVFGFKFRELYGSKTEYRIDGIWGGKTRYCLFPLNEGQLFSNLSIHAHRCPINSEYKMELLDINLYHLKMISRENRILRRDVYKQVDVNNVQTLGYDYLTDEKDIVLEVIPNDRLFYPDNDAAINHIGE